MFQVTLTRGHRHSIQEKVMLHKDIKVDHYYRAKVNNRVVTVRVEQIEDAYRGYRYMVMNMLTRRRTSFRSAQKFRSECSVNGHSLDRPVKAVSAKDVKKMFEAKDRAAEKAIARAEEGEHRFPFVERGGSEPQTDTKNAGSADQSLPATGSSLKTVNPPSIQTSLPDDAVAGHVGPRETQATSLSDILRRSVEKVKADQSTHMEMQALAGTGKTTTVIEGCLDVKGMKTRIKPSDQQRAIWECLRLGRNDSMRLSAFNVGITDVLKEQVIQTGLFKVGVEARGIHSLGLAAVTKIFGRLKATNFATLDLIARVLGHSSYDDVKHEEQYAAVIPAVNELVKHCKCSLMDPTPENITHLASYYDVDMDGTDGKVFDLVPQVLELAKKPERDSTMSFDDMVWLPLVYNLPIPKVDLQIVDESQDLNRMQQKLIYRAGHRIAFIGDRHQAIYGFSGADAESMDRMAKTLRETKRGLTTLPLTMTRRCGKAIVAEAQGIVPEFEAWEGNPAGKVSYAKYPVRGRGGNYWDQSQKQLKWEESYCCKVQPGDMCVCRVNAPLVGQCFRFLAKNINARVLGRKIGEGLEALIKKSRAKTPDMLMGWLDDWLNREIAAENKRKFPCEHKIITLQDKFDCLMVFASNSDTMDQVRSRINYLFTDNKESPSIKFASIHKSKGLEAKRVFLLEPEGATVPHPMAKSAWQKEQEMNLRYVAITRAIEELVYVS
jgi:hypothetical protein